MWENVGMSTALLQHASQVAAAAASLSTAAGDFGTLTEDELRAFASTISGIRRCVNAQDALLAGEISRRSARALGSAGLAQKNGFRTPVEMVRVVTGVSKVDAGRAVKVGELMLEAAQVPDAATGVIPDATHPWLHDVAAAVAAGTLSPAAADAIRIGLGVPSQDVTVAMLAEAVRHLLEFDLDPDRLTKKARELRDDIDELGIKDREKAMREKRSLTFTKLPNGMSRLVWVMDPLTAAAVGDLYDRTTSPRRGGPRFVNPDDAVISTAITDDTRSTEQIASDVFLHLLEHGADADDSELLKSGGPVLTVIARVDTIELGDGYGYGYGYGLIQGQDDPVCVETIQAFACDASTIELTADITGNPLDVGREQRLFNRAQRRALGIRDGGCMWPGCDAPPSWTEAHHLQQWSRDRGKTDLNNGILLCRHHHLLLHNNHWEILFHDNQHLLIPPADIDPTRTPIVLEPKRSNTLLRR
jgi:hypothetical protein